MVNQELRKAIDIFDRQSETVQKYLFDKEVRIKSSDDLRQREKMEFYDAEGNCFYSTDIEVLCYYYPQCRLFAWAWAVPSSHSASTFLARQLLQFCLTNSTISLYTRTLLTTSRTIIRDLTQLEINIALAAMLIKQPFILPYRVETHGVTHINMIILLDDEPLRELMSKMD